MATLTIMRGPSGSGKSTHSDSLPNAVVVSRDTLRRSLFGSDGQDYYKVDKAVLRRKEDYVTQVEHTAIKQALAVGMDVVSDNTYIEPKYMKAVVAIAQRLGAQVVIKEFDVPLRTLLERNEARAAMGGRDVPREVIEAQYARFQQTKGYRVPDPELPDAYNGTPGKPKAFLVDIDGTLAHMNGKRGPFDWKKVGLDDVDEVIAEIVSMLVWFPEPYNVIVMSGRDEECRGETEAWLSKHGITYDHLFMRPNKDMRKDSIVKAELFDEHVRDNFDVRFVLDDRQQVVDMWRDMGITCLQVAPGDF